MLHVTYYKDFLSQKLQIAPTDPGAWHLHSETTQEYAKQMCVEYKDEKGLWQCPKSRANHYWDCGVYGLAAVEILGIKFWKRKEEGTKVEKSKQRKRKTTGNRWGW